MYLILGLLLPVLLLVLDFWRRKMNRGRCTSNRNMSGKVVIVTGCTSGIGKETARDLARRGARVIMACRNMKTSAEVREEIIRETGNSKIDVRQVDLSCLQSVRDFCAQINQSESKIDVLVHNAGYAGVFNKAISVDGYEMTMATNQYGPFLMTHLLIDLLKKSSPCRIVVVSSSLYLFSMFSCDNGGNYVSGFPPSMYCLSKYANIQFAVELARRLRGTGVTVNCLTPGLIRTDIFRHYPYPLNIIVNFIIKIIARDAEEGAQCTLHLAVDEQLEGVTGKYYSECKEVALRRDVTDLTSCKKMWESCEKIVGLTPQDPRI